ncbi:MAG TPA: SCP2 sterol-binding domain-containing protein [Sulfuriferula sp.]|nr:SCP2 sterol-binding domain-containing protein [Sulfuriferula sp.]
MPSGLAASAGLPLLNHLLHGAPWARERLQAWAGKTVSIELFPLHFTLAVTAAGTFAAAEASTAPDAHIQLTPLQAARLAMKDPAAFRNVAIDGDAQFAAALGSIFRELDWDVEADLARMVGDVVAHRIVRGARSLHEWQRHAADSTQHTLVEYATEERPLLAKRRHVASFIAEVDAVRDDVARLEKRLQLFAAHRNQN